MNCAFFEEQLELDAGVSDFGRRIILANFFEGRKCGNYAKNINKLMQQRWTKKGSG